MYVCMYAYMYVCLYVKENVYMNLNEQQCIWVTFFLSVFRKFSLIFFFEKSSWVCYLQKKKERKKGKRFPKFTP